MARLLVVADLMLLLDEVVLFPALVFPAPSSFLA